MRTQPDPHLAHLLYQALIVEGSNITAVARRSGLGAHKLYSLCEGRRHVLAQDLPALWRGTNDLDLYSGLCGAADCDLVIAQAAAPADRVGDNRRSAALRVAGGAGRVAELVDKAEADGILTDQERDEISHEIQRLEREAERLRQLLSPTLSARRP